MKAKLLQNNDDSWKMEVTWDSGLVEILSLGKLSKEQAMREALRRAPGVVIHVWDKVVLQAIKEGKVAGMVEVQNPK